MSARAGLLAMSARLNLNHHDAGPAGRAECAAGQLLNARAGLLAVSARLACELRTDWIFEGILASEGPAQADGRNLKLAATG